MIDEGEETCIMSMSGWKYLGSPPFITSQTLLKEFDGHTIKPHGIITTLLVELGGKIVSIEVEVVDVSLNYNFILGCTWLYVMKVIEFIVFQVRHFPHNT